MTSDIYGPTPPAEVCGPVSAPPSARPMPGLLIAASSPGEGKLRATIDYDPEAFSFDIALHHLKSGNKVARRGWNGRSMFLFYVPAGAVAVPFHLPCEGESIGEFIAMKTAQGTVIPWLASQTDLLAHDWTTVA